MEHLKEFVEFKISNNKYEDYLRNMGKIYYKESLDDNLQKYYENFKKLETNKEKWEEKTRYCNSTKEKDYDDGMNKYNEEDEKTYVDNYIKKYMDDEEMKNRFIELKFNEISLHNGITLEMVKNNLELKWDWCAISGHKNITWEMIKNNPELPWDYEGILSNKNIKFEDLKKYIIEKNELSETNWINELKEKEKDKLLTGESPTLNQINWNRGITEEDILSNPEMNWDYYLMSCNCNISFKFVFDNINYDWDMNRLFSNNGQNVILVMNL